MSKNSKTQGLFDDLESWKKEWKGMPEFIQEDLTSFRKIVIHFRSEEDVQEFSKLIQQKITPKQPSLWFPKMEFRKFSNKRYTDESNIPNIHNIKRKVGK